MNQLRAIFFYEWKRTLTFGRISWWFLLTAFPVLITLLVRAEANFRDVGMEQPQIETVWTLMFYMLIPCVCCCLGVFLNAAPAIAGELEQRSWVYLATRPWGIFWLLVGKYIIAVVWASSAAIVSASLAIPLIESQDHTKMWFTICSISLLSSMAYAALYLMIGALFPKRAMVFSVTYTALVEVVLSLIPAIINRFTIQYRLRSLLIQWIEISPEGRRELMENLFFKYVFAEEVSSVQIVWLLGLTGLFLTGSIIAAHVSEFTAASESDV
ncbi:MAG: hypothetical protein JNL58_01365 [Planctomyces sp.]|nr:hypothetical protein [Planctomyces sp.]